MGNISIFQYTQIGIAVVEPHRNSFDVWAGFELWDCLLHPYVVFSDHETFNRMLIWLRVSFHELMSDGSSLMACFVSDIYLKMWGQLILSSTALGSNKAGVVRSLLLSLHLGSYVWMDSRLSWKSSLAQIVSWLRASWSIWHDVWWLWTAWRCEWNLSIKYTKIIKNLSLSTGCLGDWKRLHAMMAYFLFIYTQGNKVRWKSPVCLNISDHCIAEINS